MYSVRFGGSLRGKLRKTADYTDVTDALLGWRPPRRTPYNWMGARFGAFGSRQPRDALPVFYPRYPCKSGACHAGDVRGRPVKIISAFARTAFGTRDRRAKGPTLGSKSLSSAGVMGASAVNHATISGVCSSRARVEIAPLFSPTIV